MRWVMTLCAGLVACGPKTEPVVDAGTPIELASISAHIHTCGVTADGDAYCWGRNGSWQLGDGTQHDRLVATRVSGSVRFSQLTTSRGNHTCGVATDGTAWCWGFNDQGALGDGTTSSRFVPTQVSTVSGFTQLSARLSHTCGVTSAQVTYCWGNNGSGQLGDGTMTARLTPTPVGGTVSFSQVSVGEAHTCGLATDGLAHCWGSNDQYGRLGDGSIVTRVLPVPVTGGLRFTQLSAAALHTCGLANDDKVHCWGSNMLGELGDGTTTTPRMTPTPVIGSGRFLQVSASPTGGFTCGVGTDNAVYCWGSNDTGQHGDGTTTTHLMPAPASGATAFTQVSAGAAHVCAIGTGGSTWCWGFNGQGRLGDGTTDARLTPVRVVH